MILYICNTAAVGLFGIILSAAFCNIRWDRKNVLWMAAATVAIYILQAVVYFGIDTTQGGMAVREFSDYDSISPWAGQSMTWAVNAGILSGRGNNTLAPTAGATRAEMAVMLQQFVKLTEK